MFQKNAIKLSLILCSLIITKDVWSKNSYKNQIIGGRAATMGGAYTAIADDSSSLFYNPAGLTYIQGTNLSGSANLYAINQSTYKTTIGNNDWERKSENLYPGYFGIGKKSGKWGFAIGYALIDRTKENQNQLYQNVSTGSGTADYYTLVMNTDDSHYLLSLGGAYEFSSRFSLGMTLNYSLRKYQRLQDQYIEYTDTTKESAFDFKEIKSKGVKPQIGVMWALTDKLSLGLNFAKDIILTQITEDVRNKKEKTTVSPSFVRQTSLVKDKTPFELMSGLAYFQNPEWLYSFNFDYYLETDNSKDNVFNISFGLEHFYRPDKAFRAGLYTNRTNVREYNNTSRNLDERVQKYGFSLGQAFYSHNNEVTFGALYSRGSGEVQPFLGSTAKRDVTYYDLTFILSSNYNF